MWGSACAVQGVAFSVALKDFEIRSHLLLVMGERSNGPGTSNRIPN